MKWLALALLIAVPASAQTTAQTTAQTIAPPRKSLRPAWQRHVTVAVGAAFHELYGIPYGVGMAQLRFGAELPHFGMYGEVIGEAGAAAPLLPLEHLRAGFLVQGIWGRYRFGTGFRGGELFVQRATESVTNYGGTISLYVMGSVDVRKWSRRALYLGIEVGVDFTLFPGNDEGDSQTDVSPSAALQVGIRL